MSKDFEKKFANKEFLRAGFRRSLLDAPAAPSWYSYDDKTMMGGAWHRVVVHDRWRGDEVFRSARNVYDLLSPEARHFVHLQVVQRCRVGIIYVPQTAEMLNAHFAKWNRDRPFRHV